MIAPWRQIIYLTIIESINSLNQSLSVSMLLYPGKKLLKTILFFCYCSSIVNYKIMRYWEILENVCEEQGFYNCLRQGFGITPKIWSFCTLEFTVHSALFLAVCKQHREEILRSEEMEKRKRKFCQNNNKANWFK